MLTEADLGEPFASGGTADLYALPDGRVLKLFADWVPERLPLQEATNGRIAHDLGLPVPRSWPAEPVGGRLGIPMERVDGRMLAEHLFEHPDDVTADAARVAAVHARIGECRHADLQPGRVRSRQMIEAADLDAAVRAAVLDRLDALDDGDALCHGDFHAGNVLRTTTGDLVVIDWGAAHAGSAACDATQAVVAMTEWLSMGLPAAWKDVVERFIGAYRAARTDIDDGLIDAWTPVVAAMRLGSPHPPTSDAPLRTLIALAH